MAESNFKMSEKVMHSCRFYVLWCTQYKRKVLVGDIGERLREKIKEACEDKQIEIYEMEIMPNYVSMLVGVIPQLGIHRAVKHIKRYTAGIREEFPELQGKIPSLWTHPYLVSTVGEIPRSEREEFIASQKTSQR